MTARRAGVIGGALGAVAAAAAAGVAVERYAIGRIRGDGAAGDTFDVAPPDRTRTVIAADGVPLHVEEVGPGDAALTVVLVHGYALSLASWLFQRRDLAGIAGLRLVLYDQRGHGRSARGPAEHATIEQLAADLETVIRDVCGDRPVALIGHSMGGMTVLALAGLRPELFGDRVVAVGLVSTSAGRLTTAAGPLRTALVRSLRPMQYLASATLRHTPALIADRTRRAGADLAWVLTRHYGFGSPEVSPALVGFVDTMIAATPVDVIGELLPEFSDHDLHAALPGLLDIPTAVVVGSRDQVTPPAHSADMAAVLPHARLVEVPGAGHLVMLEDPEPVSAALRDLIQPIAQALLSRGGGGLRLGHSRKSG